MKELRQPPDAGPLLWDLYWSFVVSCVIVNSRADTFESGVMVTETVISSPGLAVILLTDRLIGPAALIVNPREKTPANTIMAMHMAAAFKAVRFFTINPLTFYNLSGFTFFVSLILLPE